MQLHARKDNLVMQTAGNEIMVYDLLVNKTYLLNETTSFVWQLCDGNNDVSDISRALAEKSNQPVNEDIVRLAIDLLKANDLMSEVEPIPNFFNKTSRRKMIKQIGLATMIALPMISTLMAPAAANAASAAAAIAACQPCTSPAQCASGNCAPNGGRICSKGTHTNAAYPAGYVQGTEPLNCPSFGVGYCCTGASVFSGGFCRCTLS